MTSFKNLQLPDFIIADIYKNDLVAWNKEKKVEEKKSVEPVENKKWFLGENQKNIVIVLQDETAVFLRDEWLQFLSNILAACHLNIGDVSIVNLTNHPATYKEIISRLQPKYFILFDIDLQRFQLPFIIPNYHLQQYNQSQLLLCASLQQMDGNSQEAKLEKSKLWVSLKKMFDIKN
jgi:hypothetical protein